MESPGQGVRGPEQKGSGAKPRKSGGPKGGGPKGEKPNISRSFFPSHVPCFALSRGLLVELWPRVGAVDFSNCACGLPGSVCEAPAAFGGPRQGLRRRWARESWAGGPGQGWGQRVGAQFAWNFFMPRVGQQVGALEKQQVNQELINFSVGNQLVDQKLMNLLVFQINLLINMLINFCTAVHCQTLTSRRGRGGPRPKKRRRAQRKRVRFVEVCQTGLQPHYRGDDLFD